MRFPPEWYQRHETLAHYVPHVRPAQRRGLALWGYGTMLAPSACQNAGITALLAVRAWPGVRECLRDWRYDGQERAAPCQTQLDVPRCFAPRLRWVLAWWQGSALALALDATAHGERVVVLVISGLDRSKASPVAWQVLPANQPGAWMPPRLRRLRQLRPAVPRARRGVVLADQGVWSPRLWQRVQDLHWHPRVRRHDTLHLQPLGPPRCPARQRVPGPGHAWVGRGVALCARPVQRQGPLGVVWDQAQERPGVVLTDLPPTRVGVCG